MVENYVSSKDFLPRIKHHMLSYPTHFLKIGDRLFWINFLADEIWRSKTLAQPNVFHSLFSTNKTNFCIFIEFCCCFFFLGPFIAKYKKFHEKSPFFNDHHYSNSLAFSNQNESI